MNLDEYYFTLTNGEKTKVDKDVYIQYKGINFFKGGGDGKEKGYVQFYQDKKKLYLHRVVINAPKGKVVDHINHDRLDNRRKNLRICTVSQNGINVPKWKMNTSSKYKGLRHNTYNNGCWDVTVRKDNKRMYYGNFKTEISAANAYNYYTKLFNKEFAVLNNCPYMSKDEWLKYKIIKQKADLQSPYPYINWDKDYEKWRVVIHHKYKRYNLGRYDNIAKAVLDVNAFYINNDLVKKSQHDVRPKYIMYLEDDDIELLNKQQIDHYSWQLTHQIDETKAKKFKKYNQQDYLQLDN
jgi:hypothetical protein